MKELEWGPTALQKLTRFQRIDYKELQLVKGNGVRCSGAKTAWTEERLGCVKSVRSKRRVG